MTDNANPECVQYVRDYCVAHLHPDSNGGYSIYLPMYPDGCDFLVYGRWVARAYGDGTWDKVDLSAPYSFVN